LTAAWVVAIHTVPNSGIRTRMTGPDSLIAAKVGNGLRLNACEHRSNGAAGGSWTLFMMTLLDCPV